MTVRQAIIVLLLAVALAGGAVHFTRIVLAPPAAPDVPWKRYVHPNVQKLKEAQKLADAGRFPEARVILVGALTSMPRSPVTLELRDLLGEINTRLFFEKETSPRKTEYTVARGDALSSIARRLQSSTDAIMRVNGLNSAMIKPGETLIVPRLDFTITIDLPRQRVVVHDGHGFFTQYPVASVDLPKTRANKVETKVTAKSFWSDGKAVTRLPGSDTAGATPWILLRRQGYVLYGVEDKNDASSPEIGIEGEPDTAITSFEAKKPPQGIAMLQRDITELELLIRRGTPVTIILDH